ncbi:hypothetical protein KAU45_04850 [bacterium]|nr:hypothetical protein [bacterium]
MPITPNQQNPGCNTGIITAVITLVVFGGVVAFLVSDGDADYFPGFLVPLIFIFVVIPLISRAVKKARNAAKGGSSATPGARPVSATHPPSGTHRPYRYRPDTGTETTAGERKVVILAEETPVNEEEHRRAVSKIIAERLSQEESVEALELDVTFVAEEEEERPRQDSRERKRQLTEAAEAIRERNRQLSVDAGTDVPPGYTVCLSCGNITQMKGRRTRCPSCGSIIEIE